MNKWKWAFWICFVLLIASSSVLLLGIVDQAITITYMEQGFEDQRKANEVLGNLIVRGGKDYTQADFLHLLRQAYPDEFIVQEGSVISMGQNEFTFSQGRLSGAK